MIAKKFILFATFIFIFAQHFSRADKPLKTENDVFSLLTSDSTKVWDPHYQFTNEVFGRGWIFSSDSAFKEFYYQDGVRREMTYGGIKWDGFRFEIKGDSIHILDYNDYKFVIHKITEDSLIVSDVSSIRYTYLDTVLYLKSPNQVYIPR